MIRLMKYNSFYIVGKISESVGMTLFVGTKKECKEFIENYKEG